MTDTILNFLDLHTKAYNITNDFIRTGVQFIHSGRASYPDAVRYPCEREAFRKRHEGFEEENGGLVYQIHDRRFQVVAE